INSLGADVSAEQKRCVQAIQSGVTRMELLTRDVLALSQAMHDPAESKPVEVSVCLRAAIDACLPLIQETGARIVYESLPGVMANDGHLTQVFQNLLSNAMKYRKPDTSPVIEIGSAVEGSQAVLSIKDNGIGFDPADAEKIFGVFHRLH